MTDRRASFLKLYSEGATIAQAGILFGLTAAEMHRALWQARISKVTQMPLPPSPEPMQTKPRPIVGRIWCIQCDRNVTCGEADRCQSPWCKAKQEKAA